MQVMQKEYGRDPNKEKKLTYFYDDIVIACYIAKDHLARNYVHLIIEISTAPIEWSK